MTTLAGQGAAQENFEIQVYSSETVPAGSTMVELHSNVAARGTTTTVEGVRPTQGAADIRERRDSPGDQFCHGP